MASPLWSLTNRNIDNRGTKINPKLTTVTTTNPQGWETLRKFSNNTTFQYRIDSQGRVGYRLGESGNQYANLQQYADSLAGKVSTPEIQKEINGIKTNLTGVLTTRTQNILPSQGAPPSRAGGPQGPNAPGGDNGSNPEGTPQENNISDTFFNVTSDNFNKDEKYNSANLIYPKDMNPSQDRIMIVQKFYKPVSKDIFGDSARALSEDRFNNLSSVEDILGTVILPMPSDISETNVTAWGEDSLSSLAAMFASKATGAVTNLANFDPEAFIKTLQGTFKTTFGEGTAANETIKQLLTLNAAAAVTKKFGINFNPEAFRSRITGTVINNNLELLFQGPKLRSFGFQFKLSPRSSAEATNVRNIIKFFKKGMAAKRATQDGKEAYFLGAPNVFDIHFKSGEGSSDLQSIGKIKTCALQQCVVNYTPDGGYIAYQDSNCTSQPISITLQLSFTELTPLYNQNYISDNGSVGYDISLDAISGEPETQGPQVPTPTTVDGVPTTPIPVPGVRPVAGGAPAAARAPTSSNLERYDAALKAGFKGTFQQWLNRNKGNQ